MGRLRYICALLIAKLSIIALKITKHNGTNFPGVVALKICPDFLKYINVPQKIIGVTGTNGKTTVSNLLNDSLDILGKKVINNSAGSNTITGIVSSLVYSVNPAGKQNYDIALFEIDELSARRIFPYLKPDYLIITNLSRDSIMRNAHPEYIRNILEKYIDKNTKLILNADDLISSQISPKNEKVFFGIDSLANDKTECTNIIDDCPICPVCNTRLKYTKNRYSNIGRAYCPNCDFKSPEADYLASNVNLDNMTMNIKLDGIDSEFKLYSNGTFNIYNEITLITTLHQLGFSREDILSTVAKVNITKLRFDSVTINGINFYTVLCKDKNAYAASRVFEYLSNQPGDKEILLYNNCFKEDYTWSENICYLYDADYELLNDQRIKKIVTCGSRGIDFKMRMLVAGVPEEKLVYVEDALEGVDMLEYFNNDNIYLLYGTDTKSPAPLVSEKIKNKLTNLKRRIK